MNGTASVPRTRTNTLLPPPIPPPASSVPSTSSSHIDPQPPGYAGGVWANRFIGRWGEAFYGEENVGRGDNAGRMTDFKDDGSECVSCGRDGVVTGVHSRSSVSMSLRFVPLSPTTDESPG